jgi:alkanesulfonate monooxygenase SsuD/methylene tetrahydromethanopterin reductase-like flavin-dependent oxidoreductase (luciferase family)
VKLASESSGTAPIPLSILDLSPVPAGGTPGDALRNSIQLAQVAERAGYLRYWVAEHHLVTGVASSATPVVVALIAAGTERIRVGSGATLLPNTVPLQVAEQFGTVAAVHPGRIDLGLGRVDLARLARRKEGGPRLEPPRSGPKPARVVDGLLVPALPVPLPGADLSALGYAFTLLGLDLDDPPPDYDAQVGEILDYVAGRATGKDGRPLHVLPAEGADLDVWILGSTPGSSARTAGSRGLPFAANYHVLPATVLDTVAAYRAAFRPGKLARPYLAVSADVVVAETDERARELAAPYAQWVLDIRAGRGARPYVTPAEARAREWTDAERTAVVDRVDTQIVGSPAAVVAKLATLARVTGADELVVTTITTDHADRVRSTELLAEAWAAHRVAA